jgi:hypothetical protein
VSDSVNSVIQMFQAAAAAGSVTSARDSLMRPFRDVILGSWSNPREGHERPPKGQISGLEDKQYSCLPGDEENCNPNGLFAPPTPPRTNTEGIKPSTPPRLYTPKR